MTHKSHKIAVIPGDGIGPEVTNVAFEILQLVAKKIVLPTSREYFRSASIITC